MTDQSPDSPDSTKSAGHLDDEAEQQQESSTTEGAAAAGKYDPAQGSPGPEHPTGEAFPDEAVRYDEPRQRGRADTQE